jgi:hypothetical protein
MEKRRIKPEASVEDPEQGEGTGCAGAFLFLYVNPDKAAKFFPNIRKHPLQANIKPKWYDIELNHTEIAPKSP